MKVPLVRTIMLILLWLAVPGLGPSRASAQQSPKVHVVVFGLSDEHDVFVSEATKAAAIIHTAYGGNAPVVRVNGRGKATAMIGDLKRTLTDVGAKMDAENDILLLFVTSHGTPAGALVKHRSTTEVLSPPEVEAMFDDSGIRHRILIVSACFSGVFADALANPSTLVITAADAQHPSFGCRNGNEWTYFGRAFFADSLQHNRNLKETFAKASRLIAARETKMQFPHSNPQMTGGERILAKLGQGTASDPAPADREKSRARCVLKVEALPDNTECQVFNGYSAGKRIGAFRIADRKVKSRRIGVAAGGTCPSDFLKGEMLSTSKVRAGRAVYTLAPDCRSAVKTTQ